MQHALMVEIIPDDMIAHYLSAQLPAHEPFPGSMF